MIGVTHVWPARETISRTWLSRCFGYQSFKTFLGRLHGVVAGCGGLEVGDVDGLWGSGEFGAALRFRAPKTT